MAIEPYSASLQQAYRDTLSSRGAPEVVDTSTPVQPVAVVAQVNTATTSAFVKLTDGTNNLAINTSGSLTTRPDISARQETMIRAQGQAAGVTTTTVATVTAGKTAYLVGYNVYFQGTATGTVTFKDSDGNVIARMFNVAANQSREITQTFPPGFEPTLAATKSFQIQGDNAGLTAGLVVHYYEL